MTTDELDVRVAEPRDVPEITRIYNEGIAGRTATFDTDLRTESQVSAQITGALAVHPTVVAIVDGVVAGWACLRPYSDRQCYWGVASFSVYVDRNWHRRGVGSALVRALIARAEQLGLWKMTSRIFIDNAASRALCRGLGFREVGVHVHHAQLDGKWRDVIVVERSIHAAG